MWTSCAAGHAHWGRHGAAGLLLARDGTALLQLRAGWAHQGGTWSIPGGALERGESPLEAALREAEEELGLSSDVVDVRGTFLAECGGWAYETVLAEPLGVVHTRDRAESDGHRWVPADDVDALPLHPAFRKAWDDPDGVIRAFVAGTSSAAA
ncbi:MAG: hypothetical protein JWN84_4302 [Nocardioides sp.]|nr:hypothetical protein [Nocardioides sp.]